MSHNKKKSGSKQNQKILAAQYHNDFIRKMKHVIDNTCGKDIFPLIPKKILDLVYVCRGTPFKYIADENSTIPPDIIKYSKVDLTRILIKYTITLTPYNYKISLYEYYTVAFTIIILRNYIEETTFSNDQRVKEALQYFLDDTDSFYNADKLLNDIFFCFNLGFCDLRKSLYWYNHEMYFKDAVPPKIENNIYIHSKCPEQIKVEAGAKSRAAIRVGWVFADTGPEWLSIKPSVLGYKNPFSEIPLPVYIQTHALNRLTERIDCYWEGIIQLSMIFSLQNPKIAYDTNHNLLIEYRFLNYKTGYFRADIIDGIILIRTFLFITNNGTPEGQLLEKNTGLKKLDKQYLNIDKLSTFMNSDLDKNEEAQQLFKNSGCQCLIDLFTNNNFILSKKDNFNNFNKIISYLDTKSTDSIKPNESAVLQF